MCGIFGVFRLCNSLPRGINSIVRVGSDALSHRGPDGTGFWSDERVSLGHRRLSIIDLTDSGSQPMLSASGRFVVTYNGEIYNFREIAVRLTALGWSPRGESDTEVLLGAIEHWGLDSTLELLDGMFAFALYDRHTKQVCLVRDRFGEKPLHYFTQGDLVWFGSEVKALEQVPNFPSQIGIASLESYFRLGYVPGPATIYSAVNRVQPASVAAWSLASGHSEIRTYWTPRVDSAAGGEELFALLGDSVRRRTISDRPIGAFLSGGVDSSLVCALAAQHISGSLRTFTMAWDQAEYDESRQAEKVSSAIGSSHTEIRLGRRDVVASVTELARVLDEPFADSSLLASFLVSKETRRHVVVALSGDGGDELFGGYNRHRWLPRVDSLHRIPTPIRVAASTALSTASGRIESILSHVSLDSRPRLVGDKVRKLARALRSSDLLSAYESTIAIDESLGRGFKIPAKLRSDLTSHDPVRRLRSLREIDLLHYLPDDILHKVDRSTMACGLESRAPFLQHQVAATALTMGPSDLIDRVGGKKPLRALLRLLLPDVSFDAPKTGFGVPLGSLLRSELDPILSEAVDSIERRGLPMQLSPRKALDRLHRGDDSVQHQLWAVLVFEMWAEHRTFTLA